MSTQRVFAARLAGCAVFDPVGDRLGKVRDVVVVYRSTAAPRVIGLVVEIPGRRQVFLSIGRVTSIRAGQVISTGLKSMLPLIWTRAVTVFGPAVQVTLPTTEPSR